MFAEQRSKLLMDFAEFVRISSRNSPITERTDAILQTTRNYVVGNQTSKAAFYGSFLILIGTFFSGHYTRISRPDNNEFNGRESRKAIGLML
jgi:hypothetical protein